jgi:hypothetical protein
LDIIKQHQTDGNHQSWVSGTFHAADPGEEVPAGSLELTIKVPTGLKFLLFPEVLRLEEKEQDEEEQDGTLEEMESSDSESELSECGYISDIHF